MADRIIELDHPDSPGRNVWHDERSKAFPAPRASTVKTVTHPRYRIGVLDQGQLGSCTGNSAIGLLASRPFYQTMKLEDKKKLGQEMAISVYSDATRIDPFRGQYPPTDTGSSGLAVLKVLQQRGLIGRYYHCFGIQHALETLTLKPVIIGIPWYSSFNYPDVRGFLNITPDAKPQGGHEVQLRGLNVIGQYVEGWNSWSDAWGLNGRFRMKFETLDRLLKEYGDVATADPIA